MKRILKYSSLGICMIFLVISCKVAFVGGNKGENLRPAKLYRKLLENEYKYENLTLKFSAELKVGEETEEFSGIIRMCKDTAIWVSLRSYNIEGARFLITKDSVKFINRLEKTFYTGDFEFIKERFQMDMDYNMLQSIITNTFFFYPIPEDTVKAITNLKPCNDSNLYCMSSISERKYTKYYVDEKNQDRWERRLEKEIEDTLGDSDMLNSTNEFVFQFVKVMPDLYRIHDMFLENYIQQQSLYIEYGKQYLNDDQYFPHNILIELTTPKFAPILEINVESITIDAESMSFPFKISSKYKKIELK